MDLSARKTHVALFTSLGLGHIIPASEFSRLLATEHNCKVTFITFPWEPKSRQDKILTAFVSSGQDIHLLPIDPVDADDIYTDKSLKIESVVSLVMERSKPSVESALRSIKDPVDAFVVDFFCTCMIDVAATLSIPPYLFYASGTTALALMLQLPKVQTRYQESFKDMDGTVHIDGLPVVHPHDLPEPVQDRTSDAFRWFVHHGRRFAEFKGVFVNSFSDLEPTPLKLLQTGKGDLLPDTVPPVYAVGPIVVKENKSSATERETCLVWLDSQPEKSVVFVSFGSGATFSKEQIMEIALGLQESGQRFLWVVRRPLSADSASTYVKMADTDVEDLLPPGFLEETKGRGLIVPTWAPQMEVLSHPSTGGFVCHCGWNSTLEAVWTGVPVITWPVFAEQMLNKEIVVQEMGIGIRVRREKDGFVTKEEVAKSVGDLMEGEEGKKAREKAQVLMDKARSAVSVGGSSYAALAEGVAKLRCGDSNGTHVGANFV